MVKSCDYSIPNDTNLINEKTACAIITFDINGFEKQPNLISSNSQINDQFQVFSYNNGMATSLNSIENKIWYSKEKKSFLKKNINSILLLIEMNKYFRCGKSMIYHILQFSQIFIKKSFPFIVTSRSAVIQRALARRISITYENFLFTIHSSLFTS